MLRKLGIDVQIKGYVSSLLYASMGAGGILHNGKFDLDMYGWIAGIDPDNASQFDCSYQPPQGNNDFRYCSKEMDAQQRIALTSFDLAKRRAAYAKIEGLVATDLPLVPIWWPRQIQAINPDFKGFAPNPVTESWNAWQWSI
jgi:peptide/nickel transport system substrate-binding protein